jgi:hypothetical protein
MRKKGHHTQGINIAILLIVSLVSLETMTERIMANPTEERIDGIWKTEGHNLIVEIHNGEFTVHEITTISCLPVDSW